MSNSVIPLATYRNGNDEGDGKEEKRRGINPNVYATKKTVAQGMLDVALLTANASQLKYVLSRGQEEGKGHEFFTLMVVLISLSIVFQVLVGILFISLAFYDFNDMPSQRRLNIVNNVATVLVFVITVLNILISGFGIGDSG